MRKLQLDTFETDSPIRKNFKAIEDDRREMVIPKANFKFIEFDIDQAYTGGDPITSDNTFYLKHNLSFIPKDFIITSVSNEATVTILYDETDEDFVYIEADGDCTVRMFMGSYTETIFE